jgi:hypothetical protein
LGVAVGAEGGEGEMINAVSLRPDRTPDATWVCSGYDAVQRFISACQVLGHKYEVLHSMDQSYTDYTINIWWRD